MAANVNSVLNTVRKPVLLIVLTSKELTLFSQWNPYLHLKLFCLLTRYFLIPSLKRD